MFSDYRLQITDYVFRLQIVFLDYRLYFPITDYKHYIKRRLRHCRSVLRRFNIRFDKL
jgi:hypothetical protein